MNNRILVVSDEVQFRRAVELALSSQGHVVVLAASLREALAVAALTPPCVLVTDLVIDGQRTGLALAETLKRGFPSLRCLLVHDAPALELATDRAETGWIYAFCRPFSMVRFAAAAAEAMRYVATESA